ncbi:MAG: type IX secretion system membrane protein PorP/SprF [Bacteroidales bacterium]|nr:type IX secretion system membrane protein PorP/SprF [Bacteroidales bacterium]
MNRNRFNILWLSLTFTCMLFSLGVQAQQDPQFSMNMFNHMAVNPGFAGSQGMTSLAVLNRQQWMGFEGNPKTTFFSANTPVKPFGINSGVGLTFMDDKLGFEKNMGINLSYAYRMNLGGGNLGIGLSIGLLSKTLKGEWSIPDSDFHFSASQDPAIPTGEESAMAFDMGFGAFYNTDNFYVGLAASHLLEPTIDYGLSAKTDIRRHYYLTSGYNFQLANPIFEIQPSLFAKSDGASFQLDVNAILLYNKKFWGGVSYRLSDAVVFMGGMEMANGLRIGVAYDFTTSAIAAYSNGTVEFMLSYSLEIGTDKSSQKYRSVRFL